MREELINIKGDDEIPLSRVITRESLIKSISAMFLNKPHLVAGYYGKLVQDMGEDIFNKEHDQISYYISSLTYFKLDELFNNNHFDRITKRFRYQIIMIFRFLVCKITFPNILDKGQTKRQCDNLLEVLADKDKTLEYFKIADEFLKSDILELDFEDRKTVERKNTTEIIMEKLIEKYLRK